MHSGPPITILTSGIGLGVYMPALLIERQLRAHGAAAEVQVLEGYFTADSQRRHVAHKGAYHRNFDLALMAHRMTRGVEANLDEGRIDELLARWSGEARTRFIVWSGFWLPILERYRRRLGVPLQIDVCRIDAVVSASFRAHPELARDATEIWLWNDEEKRTVFEIPVDDRLPLPFVERADRLIVHGGGWGIGTYQQALAGLHGGESGRPWACDVVVHDRAEIGSTATGLDGDQDPRRRDRFFMVDPEWRAWHRDPDGRHRFPPFGEVDAARAPGSDEHALYEIIRRGKAIVSKPGGGTLIDSLSSATPVVLLEPLGYAEASNGAVWEHLGFGIPYSKWRETGYSAAVLERLHHNLLHRSPVGPAYPLDYLRRVQGGARERRPDRQRPGPRDDA